MKEPSIQKPGWFKALVNRIDPSYDILESWIKGRGNKDSDDFETGVAILLSLCGLNVIHVGGQYERATLKNRLKAFANPNVSLDVLAWHPDVHCLYLCQCSIGSVKEEKINDIATIVNEIDNIILSDYATKPRIYPVIVTNIGYKNTIEGIREGAEKNLLEMTLLLHINRFTIYLQLKI